MRMTQSFGFSDLSHGGGGPSRAGALLWLPLLMGGIVATVVAAKSRRIRQWLERLSSSGLPTQQQRSPRRFVLLRQAIVGNDKESVAAVFGAPPTTAGTTSPVPAGSPPYLAADTWYYPLDPVEQHAMVVSFRDGIAREAQFIRAPQWM
jgi:hypothetical protein